MPLLAVGLYSHNLWLLAALIVWIIINPMLFPAPKRIDNWMSKGVLGEKLYYKDKKYFKKDLPTLLNALNIPTALAFLWFAWNQDLVALTLSGLLVMTIKFWFIDRMVQVYEAGL
ncbi:hypothetical protein M0Q28_01190 [Patescibacteria group bacterium]|nr:hypothetical protein [Patescibacteria group bacterium]